MTAIVFPKKTLYNKPMKHMWIRAWALQILEMLAVCLLAALAEGAGALLHGLLLWGLVPLAGLLSACRAVRRGLNNYLAWIAPIHCLYGANRLVWGFSPPAGAALLAALAALVGAAAGQVMLQRQDKTHSRQRRG